MKTGFETKDGSIVAAPPERAPILVYTTPDDRDKQELVETWRLDRYDVESALDPDEIPRVEFSPERTSIIWKRPKSASFGPQIRLDVSSIGLFLQQDRLIIVVADEPPSFAGKEFHGATSPIEVLMRCLLHAVHHYQGHLKVIKQITVELESKISSSMGNRYLLQMFALGESLIYYLDGIEANGAVLLRLRGAAERLGLSKPQIESLDDLVLENQQCARQAQIFSSVLSGLMDARGTIINNNMNVLLKNLTLINIVFLPLNLIAGIGGMSEFSMMTRGLDWRLSYLLFCVGMVVVGWVTLIAIQRILDRPPSRAGTVTRTAPAQRRERAGSTTARN